MGLALALGVLIAGLVWVPGRAGAAPQEDVIRVSTNLVTVPVSVTGPDGQPVRGLTPRDFRLEVEGQPKQVVSLGEPGKTPIELVLLLDISGSVQDRLDFQKEAAAAFLRLLMKPQDSVSLFSVGIETAIVQPRTLSTALAIEGLQKIQPTREATAFFDAVVQASRYLAKNANPGTRRVLVALSDGEDNQSTHRVAEAARELQRNDCLFYSINPSGTAIRLNVISQRGQEWLERLAAETGGAFVPANGADLNRVFQQIASELQAQYLLGFYDPAAAAGQFRRIAVKVPGRMDVKVRARQGYYGPAA